MISDPFYAAFFWFFTALILVSGVMAAMLRSIIKSALAMFFTFFGMAGLFLLLGADFLAVTQIVIYAGGILIMIVVGILLTHRSITALHLQNRKTYILAGISSCAFLASLFWLLFNAPGLQWHTAPMPPADPTTRDIGALLLTRYLLPFEVASLTILVALLGASYLVRRKE
jgi:NADH-quinone oxidoreductase subunit J